MENIALSAEALGRHPALLPDLFLGPAQACIARYHQPPQTALEVHFGMDDPRQISLNWELPDPRVALSKQRSDLLEDGAIALAAITLLECTRLLITDVTERGERADYWLGTALGDHDLLLEVSGTDEGDIGTRYAEKTRQLHESPYDCGGYVSVTRFDRPITKLGLHTAADV